MSDLIGDVRITGPSTFEVFDGDRWIPSSNGSDTMLVQRGPAKSGYRDVTLSEMHNMGLRPKDYAAAAHGGGVEVIPKRILASATAEMLRFGPVPLWSIEVTGVEPHGWRRVYEIEAASDTIAAQEGIRRFVEEAEILAGIA